MTIQLFFFLLTIPLYWWQPERGLNFGDELSAYLVEKIAKKPVDRCLKGQKKLLAIGSILQFAEENDVVWGSGIGGKDLEGSFAFNKLDVRAVRGPLTRAFLERRGIACPEVYGDPALLLPLFFPQFKKARLPTNEYIIIPHIGEMEKFRHLRHIVMPTEDWKSVIHQILQSKLVISGSLHGIVVAEAFGIPARCLKMGSSDRPFKYEDYYLGTGRAHFRIARSIEEALKMGGEPAPVFDRQALLNAFPHDFCNR